MTLRVCVVDDSDIAAQRIARILESDDDVRVIKRFASVDELRAWGDLDTASVVVLDVWMPGASGLGAIREIAARVPVVVVSDVAEGSDVALEAVAQGAVAFVSKRELGTEPGETRLRAIVRDAATQSIARELPVLVIAGSTGAPRALERLVPGLRDVPAAIVVVQHLPLGGEVGFARWIAGLGLPARPARHGDALASGRALIAPAGRHLVIENGVVRLVAGAIGELHVPSADRALASAASLGRRVVALVLSGMGRDGARGIALALEGSATCLALSPDECAAPSMPRHALDVSPRVRAVRLDTIVTDVREALRRRR
ncbi:chemotaxis protein CheB [Sandaracinus amylolyticus]|uniref:protein-glutamate methylesterase n=1 Tax=Sandaracinus amylolyticus TaxID=927083 RepID=A0A0F6W1B3_9BACT|nr:chemotaxis protein CheB [Sandaracinus amylolyticus]AKF04752.1 Chemotaxis response regulator protein-glutamate methylesterase CheB [Sandaracinus amylolyticus]